MKHDLLFEIGCEDIPAKFLPSLAQQWLSLFAGELQAAHIGFGDTQVFAAPRRLGFLIQQVDEQQPEQVVERRGPALAAAYTQNREPTPALQGFLKSCGTTLEALQTETTPKGEWLVYRSRMPGRATKELLPELLKASFKKLTIPKPMRWGSNKDTFIRPVRWLVFLFGEQVVPLEIFGIPSGRESRGHRFMAPQTIAINSPDEYESKLEAGFVMASFAKRKAKIEEKIQNLVESMSSANSPPEDGWHAQRDGVVDLKGPHYESLLNEVCGLTEWPVPLRCHFDKILLDVPREALVASMVGHQKCFPLFLNQPPRPAGTPPLEGNLSKLLPSFIAVSNLESGDPNQVIKGNERVMRARLSDAKFFYEEDLKYPFEPNSSHYQNLLSNITWQKGLGSLQDKSVRLAELAPFIFDLIAPEQTVAQKQAVQTAASLSKFDLVTNMVGEFPELQGVMGKYYVNAVIPAKAGIQESEIVAEAIQNHYRPRFSGDNVLMDKVSASIALADKIDTLVGLFGINQKPTGEKDPYGLRRAALGVVRIFLENKLVLKKEASSHLTYLNEVIKKSIELFELHFSLQNKNLEAELNEFIFERLRAYYKEQGRRADVFEAVYAIQGENIVDFVFRYEALEEFLKLPEAADLIAANKRVKNILPKDAFKFNRALSQLVLKEKTEELLRVAMQKVQDEFFVFHQVENNCVLESKEYYFFLLKAITLLKQPLYQFFEEDIRVMDADPVLQENRIALFYTLNQQFSRVADLFLLSS